MRYSVWNMSTRKYDYYEGGGPSTAIHAGAPPRPVFHNALGATPEQAAWPLPVDAKKVGTGDAAQGRIASMGSFGGISGILPVAIAGAVAWLLFRRKR